ncbi:glycoside hydrolase family 43 protein [Arenibacter latericius]|uniref:glycoside hydrolase family 43 protein n=1 Tax=Arenibacter latericius TaxID=86104 RepID=UPI000416E763|nr:glycoside hydrolase family 43 protein [Arenibacter latericius]
MTIRNLKHQLLAFLFCIAFGSLLSHSKRSPDSYRINTDENLEKNHEITNQFLNDNDGQNAPLFHFIAHYVKARLTAKPTIEEKLISNAGPRTTNLWDPYYIEYSIPQDEVLLFSYFKGNGEDGLHLAYSEDGFVWKALKNDTSFLSPVVGKDKLMRDPCIIKGGDGNYHMVWTVSWTYNGIGYAYSKDLINWSEQQFIPVMAHQKDNRNTWAPEITFDPDTGTYMIYWASTVSGKFPETKSEKENGYNHRIYYTTTQDFKNYAQTRLLYEPGFNVIDSHIIKIKDQYVMFLKDETIEPPQKNIKIAYSNALEGPYSAPGKPITGDYWAEGPTTAYVDGQFIVYFDKYINHQYGAVTSKDLHNWKDVSDRIKFPEGARHGTIISIPRSVLEKLKEE